MVRIVKQGIRGIIILFWLIVLVLIIYAVILTVPLIIQGNQPKPSRTVTRSTLPLSLKWTFDAPSQIRFRPIVADGRVFLTTRQEILAVDVQSGSLAWKDMTGSFLGPGIGFREQSGTVVYRSGSADILNKVNLRDGTRLWSQSQSLGMISSVATDENTVYVGYQSSEIPLRAFDLKSGRLIWNSGPDLLGGDAAHGLTLRGNSLYVFQDNSLYLLDARNGKLQKSLVNKFNGSLQEVMGDQVYLSITPIGALLVKDLSTGQTLWQFDKTLEFVSVIGQHVYVSSFVEHGSYFFFPSNFTLSAFNASNGNLLWEHEFSTEADSDFVVLDNIGYMLLKDGSIRGLDLNTGTEIGKIETSPASTTLETDDKGLATDGTYLYATFGDTKLFTFGK